PTDAMRNGDFSNVRNASGALIPIYDPLTTCGRLGNAPCAKDANGNDIITRQQFPGNVIPLNRIDPAAKVLENLWAHANGPGVQFTNVTNYTANASVGGGNDQYNPRVDHTFSEKNRMFVRYTLDQPEPADRSLQHQDMRRSLHRNIQHQPSCDRR